MPRINAEGELVESVDDFQIQPVRHANKLWLGLRVECGNRRLVAGVDFHHAGFFQDDLRFEIAHSGDLVRQCVPAFLGGEDAHRLLPAKLVAHEGEHGARAPLVGKRIVGMRDSSCGVSPQAVLAASRSECSISTPNPHPSLQTRLQRIPNHIVQLITQILSIPDKVIIAFLLPNGSAFTQQSIDLMRGEAFPRMEDFLKLLAFGGFEHRVDMVRHHTPGEKLVSDPVEVLQSVGNKTRERVVIEQAGAMAAIEFRIDFAGMEFGKLLPQRDHFFHNGARSTGVHEVLEFLEKALLLFTIANEHLRRE